VTASKLNSQANRIALFGCLFFIFAGQLFLPLLGIEDDEALFAMPIRAPKSWEYMVRIGHSNVALMLMSYLGTLKALLYKFLLQWFGSGVAAVRTPMLLGGALSVWLFYRLLRRTVGVRAAVIGCGLLATDTCYLLTSVFDWGPVVLQHLLIIGGLLLFVRFYQDRSEVALGMGAFLFGLAMWDKALAAWMISGIAIAAAVLFWREIVKLINGRRIAMLVLAFTLGALPLLVYNVANHWVTFASNFKKDTSDLRGKARLVRWTLEGRALLGLFTEEDRDTPLPHSPSGYFQNASSRLASETGDPVASLAPYGFALALLLAPAARGRDFRALLFPVLAGTVAWIQMAITQGAGGSVHHTILIWPLPHMAMAVSFAAASRRIGRAGIPAVAALTAVLMISNVLVTNEYYYRMVRKGGSVSWSDAIFTLADTLQGTGAPYVFTMDWGILDNLRLIGNGKLPVRDGMDPATVRQMLGFPGAMFAAHTKATEFFHGNVERLEKAADEMGLIRENLVTIGDSFGRPTFEVFRFREPHAERR
jgi:hypothetical protein